MLDALGYLYIFVNSVNVIRVQNIFDYTQSHFDCYDFEVDSDSPDRHLRRTDSCAPSLRARDIHISLKVCERYYASVAPPANPHRFVWVATQAVVFRLLTTLVIQSTVYILYPSLLLRLNKYLFRYSSYTLYLAIS